MPTPEDQWPQPSSPPASYDGQVDEGQDAEYRPVRTTRFTHRAFDLLADGHLELRAFWEEQRIVTVTAEGCCPRCFHRHVDKVHPTAVGEGVARSAAPAAQPQALQLVFVCRCDHRHHGAPPDSKGCGLRYRVEAEFER